MKVLTLTQPWATLVAIGSKSIETRSWRTPYRGPLAIHAAKNYPLSCADLCEDEPFKTALDGHYVQTGVILATARLVGCVPTRDLQEDGVIAVDPATGCDDFRIDRIEREFGDYTPGRWAWLFAEVKRLEVPIAASGHLGLWEFPDEYLV